jgi:hypothetical protein
MYNVRGTKDALGVAIIVAAGKGSKDAINLLGLSLKMKLGA